jgi:4-oxalocrotonate tautomerase
MPFVNVKLVEGVFDQQEKREMIGRLTDAMMAFEGDSMREATVVIIEEVQSGSWGIGGRALSTADVKAMAASG